MPTISSLGIGSGYDFESMVTGLLDAEFGPETQRLELEQQVLERKISAVGNIKSAMEEFETEVDTMASTATFEKRLASSADTDKFTISASDSAPIGTFGIEVTQLAQAHKLTLDFTGGTEDTTVGTGTITIAIGSESFDIDISSTEQSVGGIKNAINNSSSNIGVSASVIDTDDGVTLVIASNNTGEDNAMTITVDDDDGNDTDTSGLSELVYDSSGGTTNMTETNAALNATMNIDGKAVSSASNVFSNAITGVTITAVAVESSPGTETTATIIQDSESIQASLEEFIIKYNALFNAISGVSTYDPVTEETGALFGDGTTRTFLSLLSKKTTSEVSGITSDIKTLTDIGITRDRNGKLQISSQATLTAALSDSIDDVKRLFTLSSDGVGTRLEDLLGDYINSDGIYRKKELSLSTELKDVLREFEDLEGRYTRQENTLRARFSRLDATLAELDSVSDMVASSVAGLKSSSSKDK